MKALSIGLLLLLVGVCGCDIRSGEKFIAPGAGSAQLSSLNGFLWTVPGCPLLDDESMGSEETLLYFLVVCPGLKSSSYGTSTEFGRPINSYSSVWGITNGEVSVTVHWDKRADKVRIEKQEFDRKIGNVFVIIRNADGRLFSTQLPSPDADIDRKAALRFIQRHTTNDSMIADLHLAE